MLTLSYLRLYHILNGMATYFYDKIQYYLQIAGNSFALLFFRRPINCRLPECIKSYFMIWYAIIWFRFLSNKQKYRTKKESNFFFFDKNDFFRLFLCSFLEYFSVFCWIFIIFLLECRTRYFRAYILSLIAISPIGIHPWSRTARLHDKPKDLNDNICPATICLWA